MKRKLGLLDAFCIAAGGMISSGLFVLPGQAFRIAGPAVVVAYALAALLLIPSILSQVELVTAMPRSGGSYFFIERSLGALPGTLAGLAGWLSLSLKAAFAMVGIGAFAQLLWPHAALNDFQWEWIIKGVAVVCTLLFGLLNLVSVKVAGRAQVAMVLVLLAVLVVFVALGAPAVRQHPNFDHVFAKGGGALLATAAMVFVSYGGLTKVDSVAEEIHHPGRNIPRAIFMAYVLVSLLYIAAVAVVVGTLPAETLGGGPYGSLTPLSSAAGNFMGRGGLLLLSGAAILAFATTGNSAILSASRVPMAMSRDGLLPGRVQTLTRYGTPKTGIFLTCTFMIAMTTLLSIADLVKVASTMMLVVFALINISVLIMRSSGIQNYWPLFRSPLYPWTQIVGILLQVGLIVVLTAQTRSPVPALTAGGFVVACVLWYLLYAHPRIDRESALAHMMRNVVARKMKRSGLEDELRDIAFERDEVVHDRFDHLVKQAAVLDLPGPLMANEVFHKAAEALADRLDLPAAQIEQALQEREKDSSTVLQPGLAIPHVVVGGKGRFEMVLVRCREGIMFGPEIPTVRTAFILAGSDDERNFHLRALMAIAHIVQEPNFRDRWQRARGADELRDVLLLSRRMRHHERPE